MSHRFRFFVEVPVAAGDRVPLAGTDVAHARVLRLADGDAIELVAADGGVWQARIEGAAAVVDRAASAGPDVPPIELVAGALVGGRFDELVDGAVQAGAARIVPLVAGHRDAERLTARRSRLTRIARAAAKQAKRTSVPDVAEPVDHAQLLRGPTGIVLDATAPVALDRVVADMPPASGGAPLRLLVGPAEGLDATLLASLVAGGWRPARLGPTILRAELAAAVAVAVAAMHATAASVGPEE